MSAAKWWEQAVVYQVYPRSFQDSNGDGVGDLPGILSRLDHLSWLGVDALWLSPIYPSPGVDLGYDISDHTGVDPLFGNLGDLDQLIDECHGREIRLLLDLVPSHTSIEHPWFREHPDWYMWSDRDGPANNWLSTFGGPAWSRDERSGRWYLHSFYPEQPDLDWRNPEVREAMAGVIGFWLDRGVDGFRLDAIDRLIKDPAMRDDPPASAPFVLPHRPAYDVLDHVNSTNNAEIGIALQSIREAADGSFLVGEVYQPTTGLASYLPHLDTAFSFDLLHSPFEPGAIRRVLASAIEGDAVGRLAWVLSNHDFPRLATRLGPGGARLAAMLLLSLPGPVFLYQGDEIGMKDGPGTDPPIDQADRDPIRHPMQWDSSAQGGFTTGTPWLPSTDSAERNVADQRRDPESLLTLHRELIALRPRFGSGFELLEAPAETIAIGRGDHVVMLNFAEREQSLPLAGEVVLSTKPGRGGNPSGRAIAPLEGLILRRPDDA